MSKRFFAVAALVLTQLPVVAENDNILPCFCEFISYAKEGDKGVTSFRLFSDSSRKADIEFKAFAIEYADKGFLPYYIRVNGVVVEEPVVCTVEGWQYVFTENKKIVLNKGGNTIDVISPNGVIPMVSDISIVDENEGISNRYNSLGNVNCIHAVHSQDNAVSNRNVYTAFGLTDRDPVFRLGIAMNQAYGYTSLIPVYCDEGERLYIYGPSPDDYTYGPDASTIDYTVYIFNENPSVFSTSVSSQNKGILDWSATLPETGLYYVLLESKNVGETGGVTILINGSAYRNLYASNTTFSVNKENANGGISVTAPDSCYNIFTVNSRVGNSGNFQADPCLWLKCHGPGLTKIVAYNNDNIVPSDFNWGKNARIRTHLPDTASYSVLLSSNEPGYFSNDTCDLYYSFWNNPDSSYISDMLYMPNLKYEDAIESGNLCADYNCIAWSAGINYDMIWLGGNMDRDIAFLDSLYSNCEVQTDFGKIKRADSLPKYTRDGATADNCAVIIWGKYSKYKGIDSEELIITHASIKNYTDTVPHGYDWESKLGWGCLRIFHPKYSIGTDISDTVMSAYGAPVLYYRIADDNAVLHAETCRLRNTDVLLYEDIAENRVVVESTRFTASEVQKIADAADSLTSEEKSEFDSVYGEWDNFTRSRKHVSDIAEFTESEEYAALMSFVVSHPAAEYLLFDKFIGGDNMVASFIRELALAREGYKKELWNDIIYADIPDGTIRTSRTNISLYIRALMENKGNKSSDALFDSVRRSNGDEFSVNASSSTVYVNLKLTAPAECRIVAYNLMDNSSYIILPETTLVSGEYQYSSDFLKGLYVVVCSCNGNLNAKKIVVR